MSLIWLKQLFLTNVHAGAARAATSAGCFLLHPRRIVGGERGERFDRAPVLERGRIRVERRVDGCDQDPGRVLDGAQFARLIAAFGVARLRLADQLLSLRRVRDVRCAPGSAGRRSGAPAEAALDDSTIPDTSNESTTAARDLRAMTMVSTHLPSGPAVRGGLLPTVIGRYRIALCWRLAASGDSSA